MAFKEMSDNKVDDLEAQFVDKYGIAGVLDGLSRVCWNKAEHLATNWQDENWARAYEKVARKLDSYRHTIEKTGVDP
jgi:hypothetical protein